MKQGGEFLEENLSNLYKRFLHVLKEKKVGGMLWWMANKLAKM